MKGNDLKTRMNFRKNFWDNKILRWESDKYAERKLFDFNSSVKARQSIAMDNLKRICHGKKVLELGCGSGRLMSELINAGAEKYIGVDVSSLAINEAQKVALQSGLENRTEFISGDVSTLDLPDCDICFSLGLLDWLSLEEIEKLLGKIECKFFLHSFSEKTPSLDQWLHKIYIFFMNNQKDYRPIYYTRREIEVAFHLIGQTTPAFYSNPKLRFGSFIHNFPGFS